MVIIMYTFYQKTQQMRGVLDIFPIAMFYNNKDLHSRKCYSTCGNLIPLPNTTKISVYLLIFDAFQAFALFQDMTLFNYTMTFLHILTISLTIFRAISRKFQETRRLNGVENSENKRN